MIDTLAFDYNTVLPGVDYTDTLCPTWDTPKASHAAFRRGGIRASCYHVGQNPSTRAGLALSHHRNVHRATVQCASAQ